MARKKDGPTTEEILAWNDESRSRHAATKESLAKVEITVDGTSFDELARAITSKFEHVQVLASFSAGVKKIVLEPVSPRTIGTDFTGYGLPTQREYPSLDSVQGFVDGYLRGRRTASEELRELRDEKRMRERERGYPFHPMMFHPFFGPRF